jgi:hypothetical protein
MKPNQQIPTRKCRGWLKTQINVLNEANMKPMRRIEPLESDGERGSRCIRFVFC